jgi:selenide, water dikinase
LRGLGPEKSDRVLAGFSDNEDAAVVRFPPGKALVQTVDFFTPIVNDPYRFGQIAAANALSDVYAMGGQPYCAMNIVCYPMKCMGASVLAEIVRGGCDKVREAGAVLVGGHSVEDDEIKYGLSVSGVVDADGFTSNSALQPGDELLLTKPLGSGILATAVKAGWEGSDELEDTLFRWGARLNNAAGEALRRFNLKAATDVTGFGLGGHALEMARASGVLVELWLEQLPVMDRALELAGVGLVPAGSHANRRYFAAETIAAPGADSILMDIVFDAQTSGGLLLAVPGGMVEEVRAMLLEGGDLAAHVGRVSSSEDGKGELRIS